MTPSRDPLSESPGANWHLRLASGGQYGPQSNDVMRQWLAEGRITADSLVWRDGWADWKPAGSIFPGLNAARPMAPAGMPGPGVAPGMPGPGMAPRPGMPAGYAPGAAPSPYAPTPYGAPAARGMAVGYAPAEPEENEFEVAPQGRSSGGGTYIAPRRDNTMVQASLIVLVLALVVLVPLMIWALTNQPVVDRDAPKTPKTKTITKQPSGAPKARPEKKGDEKMRL